MGSRRVAAEGASHDQTSTSAVERIGFFGKLPQELKDQIHEHFLMDILGNVGEDDVVEIMGTAEEPSGYGTGQSEVSTWAFTNAFDPVYHKKDFERASKTVAGFLGRYTKFKATCTYLDLWDIGTVWNKYAALAALPPPSPLLQRSFCLTVQTCSFDRDTTLEAVALFFEKALQPGTMLLRRLELPKSRGVRPFPGLNESRSFPGPLASCENPRHLIKKLHRLIDSIESPELEKAELKQASTDYWAMTAKQATLKLPQSSGT